MAAIVFVNPVKDFTLAELREALVGHRKLGKTVYAKYTCQHCGERIRHDVPNSFPDKVTCSRCGGEHDLLKSGGNYLTIQSIPPS